MPLTDSKIRNAKSTDRPYKLFDAKGLYLYVTPAGGRIWRLKYRMYDKERLLTIGTYPEVSLADARQKQLEARALIKQGKDPSLQKQIDKLTAQKNAQNSFERVAREWVEKFQATRTEGTNQRNLRMLELHAFPWIGNRPISEIRPVELLAVLQKCEQRGTLEVAHRLRSLCSAVFCFGVATGRCEHDIANDLKGALTPRQKQNMAAIIEPIQFGQLLRDIWAYQGHFVTLVAFKLSALLALRPTELRALEWSEIDLDNAIINIKLERMKKRRAHLVPLARQALELLHTIKEHTGHLNYCFPGLQGKDRPMSENTINAALRRLGYDTQKDHTAHGFRSAFSTLANASGLFRKEVIEVSLAHRHGNEVELTYNRGNYLQERRELMQWWADECDKMRQGAEVIPLRA